MRRDAQSVVLILIGGAVLRISLSDIYLRYVKEGLRPLLLVAGACLLVLGAVGALRDGLLRDRNQPEHGDTDHRDTDPGHEHGHEHGHGPRIAWLLCLPVFAIFLVAPPALGSYAASRDAGTVARPSDDTEFPPLPAGDSVRMLMSEYAVRAIWDRGRTLQGRTVTLTGFVTPRKGGGWYLTRMTLNCCAADARALKVEVREAGGASEARGAQPPPTDTWVEVTGSWVDSGPSSRETAIPAIQAETAREIQPPKDPYE